ncbi:MAG: hypothetical protein KGJ62_02455 [Armatimonadetes bacterium]|nr:hypothetical protein [Armatimonadota bacterium]MDE2205317.1 hypothetical protein [Armatimonadota bacterium]
MDSQIGPRVKSLAFGAIAASLAVAASAAHGPVLLRMKYKAGQTLKYALTMQLATSVNVNGGEQNIPARMTMQMVRHIVKVMPSGNAQATESIENMKYMVNGNQFPTPATPSFTVVYSPLGTIVSMKTNGGSAQMKAMAGQLTSPMQNAAVYLPKQAVSPGQSWVSSGKLPAVAGGGTYTVRSRFVKAEHVGGFPTVLIHSVMDAPIAVSQAGGGTGELKMTSDSDFSPSAGKLIRVSGSGNMSMKVSNGPNGPMNMKIHMVLALSLLQ